MSQFVFDTGCCRADEFDRLCENCQDRAKKIIATHNCQSDDSDDTLPIPTWNDSPTSGPAFDRMKSTTRPLDSDEYDDDDLEGQSDDHGRTDEGETIEAVETDEDGNPVVKMAPRDGRQKADLRRRGPDRSVPKSVTDNAVYAGDDCLPFAAY